MDGEVELTMWRLIRWGALNKSDLALRMKGMTSLEERYGSRELMEAA